MIAHWWNTTPPALRHLSVREFRLMAEFRDRKTKAEQDAYDAARLGAPTPGRAPADRPSTDGGW